MKPYECCKGCEKRHPKCHAICPEKAVCDAEMEALKAKIDEKMPVYAYSKAKRERAIEKRRQKKR